MNMGQNKRIPLSKPFIGLEEQAAIIRVMESKLIASGQVIEEFEQRLADTFQRSYCVLVNSGTCALYIALKILGLKKVIFPSMTCPDVLHAILSAGIQPVFADIEPETHNIDLSTITENQFNDSDGIIVTQCYGHSADMDKIAYFTEKYHLTLVEDFAQAVGGRYKDKILGSFGQVSIASFYAAKNMTTGQGGAIFTDDPEIYKKCLYARGDAPYDYNYGIIPLNYRMTDIQAAIGLVQLKKIDKMIDSRQRIAFKLTASLKKLDVKTPIEKPGVRHTYYKYYLVLPKYLRKMDFITKMSNEGISTGVLYDPPLHKTLLVKNMFGSEITLPVCESIAPRVVSLPIFPEMTDDEISKIYKTVEKVLTNYNQ